MEFLKLVRRRRSLLSDVIYTSLNVALAIGVMLIVLYTDSVWLAIALVMLSKWRVLAVRPRYWWVNVQSNLVDFIVSVSVVMHLYTIHGAVTDSYQQILLMGAVTLVYIAWLLFLKPRSTRHMVANQALVAVFMGTTALVSYAYAYPASVMVLGMWLIGYTAAKHTLGSYDDETHQVFMSLAAGLILAEIGWITYHWTVAYSLPIVTGLQIPQVSIIVSLAGFLAVRIYDSYYHHARLRSNDILLPILLTVSVIAVLVLLFNRVGTAI